MRDTYLMQPGERAEFLMVRSLELQNALAKYMEDGNMVSPKVVQWFAERVSNPKLLHKKHGLKTTPMFHCQIRYFIELFISDLGRTT